LPIAAEQAGVASPASGYRVQWARFDNTTGLSTSVGGEITVSAPQAQAPAALADNAQQFIEVQVAAIHPQFPSWTTPVTVHFRRVEQGWKMVGLVRMPDEPLIPRADVKRTASCAACARR